jgi:tetratricopeptide (TPR) repeat protein
VIGLVQVGDQAMADRYTYIPMVGLGIMLAWGAEGVVTRWPRVSHPISFAGAALVLCWIVLTANQVAYWQDNVSLFSRTLAVTGRNYVAETVVANSLAAAGRHQEAERLFQRALEARPAYPPAHLGLGDLLLATGKPDLAAASYQRALEGNPGMVDAHNGLGSAYFNQGQFAPAAVAFERALSIDSGFAEAQFNWSLAKEHLGDRTAAAAGYRKVLQLRPDSVPARVRLAWILATHRDASQRNAAEALRLATLACEQTGNGDAGALNSLAAAYAENGRWPEAIETAQAALRLAESGGDKGNAKLGGRMIERFKTAQPYRDPEQ